MKFVKPLIAVAVIAGSAAAGWWAYEEGHVGNNPRAPKLENFRLVVDAWAERKGELKPKCVAAQASEGPGLRTGLPGLTAVNGPGLWAITAALKMPDANSYANEARERSILRLDALAKAGFLTATDSNLELDSGDIVPARQFVMTAKGWEASFQGYGLCISTGRPEVLEISSIARVQPDPQGIRAYDITYKTGVKKLPEWVASSEAKEIWGDMKTHGESAEHRLRLLRTKSGWIPEPLAKGKEKDATINMDKLTRTMNELLPALTVEKILEVAKERSEFASPKACIRLPANTAEADQIDPGLVGSMSAVIYDADPLDIRPERFTKEAWRNRMEAMVKAGLFRREPVEAGVSDGKPHPGGVRYVLEEKYQPHINKKTPSCLSLGDVTVTVLKDSVGPQTVMENPIWRFLALGKIDGKAWSRSMDLSAIPEAKAYLDYGVPISGMIALNNGEWKVSSITVLAPSIAPQSAQRASVIQAAIKASMTSFMTISASR